MSHPLEVIEEPVLGEANKPLVLIVDDSPTIRLSLTRALQEEFVILEAVDGEQAWELLRSNDRIEVLMTDLNMPNLDGYGLIKRMRNSVISRIHNLPLIVVTGTDDTEAREQAFHLGANDFVTKASDRIELLARLRAQRKLAQTIRQLEESQRELRAQANTDTLTGLANRRFFSQIANKELSLMRRKNESFAVLMMDIDHFKSVNDTYGHPAGDHVLCELARTLSNGLREEDSVARVGGEEFAVCAPYTNRLEAIVVAENLRKAAEALDIYFEGDRIPITLSIGIAVLPQDGDSLEELMSVADERLYLAKQNGRNRYCAADKLSEDSSTNLQMVCPKLDEALVMVRHGNLHRLRPHLPALLENLFPLFELANEESPQKIDLDQLRETISCLKQSP